MASPPKAPKLKALARNPKVSLTIDDNVFPHKVLLIRGSVRLQSLDGIVPEYALAAERYFGPEQGKAWVERASEHDFKHGANHGHAGMGRPARLLQTRFPGALSS